MYQPYTCDICVMSALRRTSDNKRVVAAGDKDTTCKEGAPPFDSHNLSKLVKITWQMEYDLKLIYMMKNGQTFLFTF